MDANLTSADLVILASAHNPSVLSPEWLKDRNLISDDPVNFIHTPDLSVFESKDFSLIVDRQRMQIVSKKFDSKSLEIIKNIAINYIRLLPNIPYRAYGANFVWLIKANASETIPDISIKINELNAFPEILGGHELNYGCIIKANKPPYLLKLVIEPQGENILIINFNYHHEIKNVDESKRINYISNYISLLEYSQSVVDSIIKGK
jgi:hypothetical protein